MHVIHYNFQPNMLSMKSELDAISKLLYIIIEEILIKDHLIIETCTIEVYNQIKLFLFSISNNYSIILYYFSFIALFKRIIKSIKLKCMIIIFD